MPTPAIISHHAHLIQKGINLGAAQGAEQDAGYGGRFQVFEKGRIWWHATTGAHHLRGRILEAYLQGGGPGVNPATNERELGFPASDHEFTADGQAVQARFEWGTIVETPGTAVVRLFGRLHEAWTSEKGVLGRLGYPLTDVKRLDGGRGAWFERGVLWHAEGQTDVLTGELVPPTLGQPQFADPDSPTAFEWLRFNGATNALDTRAGLAAALVSGRYALIAVGVAAKPIVLVPAAATTARDGARWLSLLMPRISGDSGPGGRPGHRPEMVDRADLAEAGLATDGGGGAAPPRPAQLPDDRLTPRQLYSLAFLEPGMAPRTISAHCLYARSDWSTFGVAHISDLHVSRRIETYRRLLRERGVPESDVAQFNSWNDCFRAFVRYANHLHAAGLLDVIMATGDLVDYTRELDDHPDGPGNFGFLAALVEGRAPGPDAENVPSEPLRVPIFTSLGNHDYRELPYPLGVDVSVKLSDAGSSLLSHIPVIGDTLADAASLVGNALSLMPGLGLLGKLDPLDIAVGALMDPIWSYAGLNITEEEARKLMGLGITVTEAQAQRLNQLGFRVTAGTNYGVPKLRPEAAARSVMVDPRLENQSHWYFRRMNRERSYTVRLGVHRLVMLDTRWDAGKTTDVIDAFLAKKVGIGPESSRNFVGASPDSVGVDTGDLGRVRAALTEAGAQGVVVVGMHAPPMNPDNTDLSNCLRETAHPTVPKEQILGWLRRADFVTAMDENAHPSWPRTGTPHFSEGKVEELLDYGIAVGEQEAFARLLAGEGAPRPVSLLVSGHGHTRVEYRLRLVNGKLITHTDHYLQNPAQYYPTRVVEGDWRDTDSHVRHHVVVRAGAPAQGTAATVRDADSPWPEWKELRVAPYANPLDAAADKRAWWTAHAPVVSQTAALGPCTNTRIGEHEERPGPNFHGFRLIQVEDDVITRVQYVGTPEVKAGKYPLAWEPSSLRGRLFEHVLERAGALLESIGQPGTPTASAPAGTDDSRVRDHRTN